MSASSSMQDATAFDRDRLCPLLAAPGIARGNTLTLRLGGESVKLRAPRHYLSKLFEWCQGDMTLAEIEAACTKQWGDARFIRFVEDLLEAGVLIDTSTIVQQAVRAAHYPNWAGRPAHEAVWRAARRSLADDAPADPFAQAPVVTLTPAAESGFSALLAQRRSADAFTDAPLPAGALGALLHAAYGMHAAGHRSVGSAGGYYGLQLHAIVLRGVDGVAQGAYAVHFDAKGRVHLQRKHADLAHLPSLVYHPHMLRHAAALLVVSADLRPSTLKYGNRSYAFALIEAGAVVQNVALAAAERGIGWRALGGLQTASVAQCCLIDQDDHVLIAGVLGMPSTGVAASGQPTPLAIDFLWSDDVPGLPFHLAMARVKPDSPAASSEFSWGRDANAWRAYDKAVAEATERYAYRQPRPLHRARWAPDADMCDPRTLIAYTRAQYADARFPFKAFNPETEYLWLKAHQLIGGEPQWVPAEFVLHRTGLPVDYLERCMTFSSSSGCASGVSAAMAQESALFELIERDAFMRHWFAQQSGIGVAPETLPPSFAHRIDALASSGCRLIVQVLDLGVQPVWMVAIQHDGKHFTAVGAAAGLDLDAVLHSAFSEAETAAYVRLAGMTSEPIRPSQVTTPAQHADLYAQRQYYRRADALLSPTRAMAFGELAPPHRREMATVYAELAARGLDALWVDLSVPNAPLTLAGERLVSGRMIVPGLIPIAFGASYQPLGMSRAVHRRARFPHPFP